jgi:hypothetical protein
MFVYTISQLEEGLKGSEQLRCSTIGTFGALSLGSLYGVRNEIIDQHVDFAVVIVDDNLHFVDDFGCDRMVQNQVVVVVLYNLLFINIVVDAQHMNKFFDFVEIYFCRRIRFLRNLKHFVQAFPNIVVDNVALLNNHILVELYKINHTANI